MRSVTSSEAAFALVGANGGVATAVALLNGVAVESYVFNTNTSSLVNYYGFANIVFDEIQIDIASFDNAFLIDNLQTTPVPEAPTTTLLLAGLAAVGIAARRTSPH